MNRQKVFLLFLLVLLVVALVIAFFRTPQLKTVDKLKYAPGTPAEARKGETAKLDDRKLHLELLDRPLPRFAGYKRNIFWIAPLETKKKLPLPPPPPFRPPPPPPPPLVQSSPVRREIAKFTFLGFLKKDNRKTIFLAKDNEIFLVKKGDRLANNYEVTKITDDMLIINSIAGGGQIVIPLVENMPLISPAE
jgi:hypothetical protein